MDDFKDTEEKKFAKKPLNITYLKRKGNTFIDKYKHIGGKRSSYYNNNRYYHLNSSVSQELNYKSFNNMNNKKYYNNFNNNNNNNNNGSTQYVKSNHPKEPSIGGHFDMSINIYKRDLVKMMIGEGIPAFLGISNGLEVSMLDRHINETKGVVYYHPLVNFYSNYTRYPFLKIEKKEQVIEYDTEVAKSISRDIIIAMERMINAGRNQPLTQYISARTDLFQLLQSVYFNNYYDDLFIELILSYMTVGQVRFIYYVTLAMRHMCQGMWIQLPFFNNRLFNSIKLRSRFTLKRLITSLPMNNNNNNNINNNNNNIDNNIDNNKSSKDIKIILQKNLITVFDRNGMASPVFSYENHDNTDRMGAPISLYSLNSVAGMRSIGVDFDQFKSIFDIYTNGMLRGIKWGKEGVDSCRVVVGGGAVFSALRYNSYSFPKYYSVFQTHLWQNLALKRKFPLNVQNIIKSYLLDDRDGWVYHVNDHLKSFSTSDIDLFLVTDDPVAAMKKTMELIKDITVNIPCEYHIVKTPNSVTIIPIYPYRPIQIVTGLLRHPIELSLWVDLDCTSFYYDSNNVYTTDRGVVSMNRKVNYIGPNDINRDRLTKYLGRGISPVIFELCKHSPRCDTEKAIDIKRGGSASLKRPPPSRRGRLQYDVDSDNLMPYGPTIGSVELIERLKSWNHPLILKAKIGYTGDLKELDRFLKENIEFTYRVEKIKQCCYQCSLPFHSELPVEVCPDCKDINQAKWNQWSSVQYDMEKPKYALVTGGRIKIGFQCAKRLLMSGYHVIVTSRFPFVTRAAFEKEPYYANWISRLSIYRCDFRDIPGVNRLIKFVHDTFPRLDVLINNAAQTIRRPRSYYYSLLQSEKTMFENSISNIAYYYSFPTPKLYIDGNLFDPTSKSNKNSALLLKDSIGETMAMNNNNNNNSMIGNNDESQALTKYSNSIMNMILLPEDEEERNDELFPPDQVDEHGEQLDLRDKTSWKATPDEISPVEIMEVQVINSTVPLMLSSKLLPLLKKTRNEGGWSCIVNVTSQEGSFDKSYQSSYHVHTNMAKASLNMMTNTIAPQYVKDGVYVCGVDTGWITKMSPANIEGPSAPLNDVDGASRILDPIFSLLHQTVINMQASSTQILPGRPGTLFKHYKPVEWS